MWDPDRTKPAEMLVHRKMWEWLFICAALDERGMLRPGRSGIGFGVGTEPLVALFASRGCRVLATDLDPERARARGWTGPGDQYAGDVAGLNKAGLCDAEAFASRVSFRHVDMNDLPDDLGAFDFSWSSCAFEHLGTLERGLAFVENQMRFVRPGGVAVHTTEFNLSSDDATVADGPTVLYRRRDLLALVARLRRAGHRVTLDLTEGDRPADLHVDSPPFTETHLRTRLADYDVTSVALVVDKPRRRPVRVVLRPWAGRVRRALAATGPARAQRRASPT
jgi:SAM-dependent methyltransferase